MRESFGIGAKSLVTEIASNDGYLLQHFVKVGVPVLGIEPACARDRSFCRCVIRRGADGVPRRRLIARFIQRRHIRPIYCEGKSIGEGRRWTNGEYSGKTNVQTRRGEGIREMVRFNGSQFIDSVRNCCGI